MIHTFQMKKILKHKEYSKLADYFRDNNFKRFEDTWGMEITTYASCGVRIYLIDNPYYPYISFVINPTTVLDKGNVTDLFTSSDDLESVIRMLDELLISMLGADYSFEKLTLARVDLCHDAQLSSAKRVKAYIKLLYNSQSRKGYKIKGRKVKGYDKSAGFACDNQSAGVGISIYDKETQLLGMGKPEAAKIAKNRLRIEVQLKSQKAIRKYQKCSSNADQLRYYIEHSEEHMDEILRTLLIDASYYKLKKAKEIVSKSEKGKLRDRMVRLLELASKYHSVRLGIIALKQECPKITDEYIKKMKSCFEEIDVNIVTLGKRSKCKSLDSIFELI